jgi:hypothetical protein
MIEPLIWLWVVGGFTTGVWFMVLRSTAEGTMNDLPASTDEIRRSRRLRR